MASPRNSMVPTAGQIIRRCLGIVNTIDLVNCFQCYTTLVVLANLLRHGSQYLSLLALLLAARRWGALHGLLARNWHGAAQVAGSALGVFMAMCNQLLLTQLLGGKRLPLRSLSRGSVVEASITTALFFLVGFGDLWAWSTRLDVEWVRGSSAAEERGAADPGGPSAEAAGTGASWADAGVLDAGARHVWRFPWEGAFLVGVALQALLRAACVLALCWAVRRRSTKVLP